MQAASSPVALPGLLRPTGHLFLLLLVGLVLSPGVVAYPDPGAATRFSSPCATANDRHFVYDFVGLLDDVEGQEVEAQACDLYQEDGAHLVLAIVPNLAGESIDQYAVHLVRDWGIGDKDRLDGLLVLYTMDDGSGSSQGAVRVEVGYGLEGTVNSLIARQAVDSMAQVKQQRLENGSSERDATAHALAAGASALAIFTRTNLEGQAQESSGGGFSMPWWGWAVLVLVVMALVSGGRRRGGSGFLMGLLLGGLLRRGGGRGGGGWGGGGSGGFGGGKSGGGGWNGRL